MLTHYSPIGGAGQWVWANSSVGLLVIFDEKLAANHLAAQAGEVFEVAVGEKKLRVYLIAVQSKRIT